MKWWCMVFFLAVVLFSTAAAHAQIVLNPQQTGSALYDRTEYYVHLPGTTTYSDYYSSTYATTGYMAVGHLNAGLRFSGMTYGGGTVNASYNVTLEGQGVVEFQLSDTTLAGLTPNNFTARLNGLVVEGYQYPAGYTIPYPYIYDFTPSMAMTVNLYDLGDGSEDGGVGANDFDSVNGGAIQALFSQIPSPLPAAFDDIDVTAALRHDLLGGGSPVYSSFLLRTPSTPDNRVLLDPDAPTLTITLRGEPATVPTMSQWGLIMTGLALAGTALYRMRRVSRRT